MTRGAGEDPEAPADVLELRETAGHIRLRLRIHPGARRAGITGVQAGALKVSVTAPPDRGRANEAVVTLLSGVLGIARGRVRIVQGEASRDKLAEIEGMTAKAVRDGLISRPQ
jgi:uncharacterized protein